MKVGDYIKKMRNEHRLTQAELGKKINVAPTAVSAWEGHKNRPLIDKIVAMSELFNVPVIDFFDEMIEERKELSHSSEQENLVKGIQRIAEKHKMDLSDPATLDLLDSALDLIRRMKEK